MIPFINIFQRLTRSPRYTRVWRCDRTIRTRIPTFQRRRNHGNSRGCFRACIFVRVPAAGGGGVVERPSGRVGDSGTLRAGELEMRTYGTRSHENMISEEEIGWLQSDGGSQKMQISQPLSLSPVHIAALARYFSSHKCPPHVDRDLPPPIP